MLRPIDAYALNNALVSWYNDTEDATEKAVLRRVMQRVVHAPTLTPPNEPLTWEGLKSEAKVNPVYSVKYGWIFPSTVKDEPYKQIWFLHQRDSLRRNCFTVIHFTAAHRRERRNLMDIEKLIERLRTESLYKDKATLEIMDLCMDAATTLSTIQAENKRLKSLLGESGQDLWSKENQRADRLEAENEKLRAELEQVKQKYEEVREAICTHCMDFPCREESCFWWRGQEGGEHGESNTH